MTEPEYVYIKGQGWVAHTGALNRVYVNKPGYPAFYLETREPREGERYAQFNKVDAKYVKGGTIDLLVFKEYIETGTYWRLEDYALKSSSPRNYLLPVFLFLLYDHPTPIPA